MKSYNDKKDKKYIPDKSPSSIKTRSVANVPENKRRAFEKAPLLVQNRYKGVNNTRGIEAEPAYNFSEVEKVFKGHTNSYLVFGKDRPSTVDSGYGGKGHSRSSAIDLVVGRFSTEPFTVDSNGDPLYANNSFKKDAARIYISQKTDIDENFGLVDGERAKNDLLKGCSGIGIKADNIRMVARKTIKIVTARNDVYDSQNRKLNNSYGIEIIAGNDRSTLSNMVRAQPLERSLRALSKTVLEVNANTSRIAEMLGSLFFYLGSHTHTVPPTPVIIGLQTGTTITNSTATDSFLSNAVNKANTDLSDIKLSAIANGTNINIIMAEEFGYEIEENGKVVKTTPPLRGFRSLLNYVN